MAEDLGIKVKVVPDTSDMKTQLATLDNKLNIKVNLVPDMKELNRALKKFQNGIKIDLKTSGGSSVTRQLNEAGKSLENAATKVSSSLGTKMNSSLNVTAKTISSISSSFGELENKISKVGNASSKSKLTAEFDSLKKSYDEFLKSGDMSTMDFSQMQQGLARVKAECDDVIEAQNQLAAAQQKAAAQAEATAGKQVESFQRQVAAANDLYNSLVRERPSERTNLGSLLDSSAYNAMDTAYSNAANAKSAFDADGSVANLNAYNSALQTLQASLKAYNQAVSQADTASKNAFNGLDQKVRDLNSLLNSLKTSYNGTALQDTGIEETITQAETALSRMREALNERSFGNQNYQQIDNLIADMGDAAQKAGTPINSLGSLMSALGTNINNAQTAIREFNREAKDEASTDSLEKRLNNLLYTVQRYADANQKIMGNSETASQYESLVGSINSSLYSGDNGQMKANINDLQKQFSELKVRAQELDLEGKTLGQTFRDLFGEHFSTAIAMGALHLMQDSLQQVFQSVLDIDSAMTELKKVTDETSVTYNRFLSDAGDRAQQLGATVSDTITATADFARLGYDLQEATDLSNAAITYKTVGDGIEDINAASESIISTMKAFGIEAEDSMRIVDKFNEVGNNFAISSAGVGDALQRSAAALHAAGNDIDESIGMIVAANNVAQDPDMVGNALKTLSLRIRGAKTELEDAGESTDGMAESTAKLREEIQALTGVDIMLDENTFKSTYDIMDELADKWQDLTDIQQASVLELVAGKNRANVVAGMLENWSDAEAAAEAAENSFGSADKELTTALDSIQGKINQFQAAFQDFSESALDSGAVKGVVDFGTGVLNLADDLTELSGVFPLVTAGLSAFLKATNTKTNGNKEDVRLRS